MLTPTTFEQCLVGSLMCLVAATQDIKDAQLRLFHVGSLWLARRSRFNARAGASLGLRTPIRLLPTPPCGDAVAFRFPLLPHHHRTWTFTSYRHDLGLARGPAAPAADS